MNRGKRPRQADESLLDKGKHAGSRLGRVGTAAWEKAKSGVGTARNQVSDTANTIRRRISGAIALEDSRTDTARHLLVASLESSTAMGERTKQALINQFEPAHSGGASRAASARDQVAQFTMGVLASNSSLAMDR